MSASVPATPWPAPKGAAVPPKPKGKKKKTVGKQLASRGAAVASKLAM